MIPRCTLALLARRHRSPAYTVTATILSLAYLFYTPRLRPHPPRPRLSILPPPRGSPLRASVIYLPLLLAAMMLNAQGRLLF